jgi:signal transduction histidine kinase
MSQVLEQKKEINGLPGENESLFRELRELAETKPQECFERTAAILNNAVQNGSELITAKCLLVNSAANYSLGDYKKSLTDANSSLEISRRINDKKSIAAALSSKGRIFIDLGDYEDALDNLLEALKILEELKDFISASHIHNNLGLVHWNCEDYEKALDEFTKSLHIKDEYGDKRGTARTLNNIGNVYKTLGESDKALENYEGSLKIDEELCNKRGMAACLNNIGTIYKDKKDYAKALDYYSRSLELKKEIGDKQGIANSYLNFGIVYSRLGEFDKALKYYFDGLKIAGEEDIKPVKKNLYYSFAELYASKGEFRKGYEYLTLYMDEKEKIFNDDVFKRFSEIQLKYEIEKTEKENELLRQRNEIQRLELETQKNLKELNATKDKFFSIIAHDLKSPFAVMTSFLNILKKTDNYEKDAVMELVNEMDKTVIASMNLLENLLEWSRTQTGRIDYAPSVLNLPAVLNEVFKLLKGNAAAKKIKLINKIDSSHRVFADKNMLNTIIRNLISNAIKFSYTGGKITVSSADNGKEIEICVKDEGTGIEPDLAENIFSVITKTKTLGTAGEKGTGIGLILCKEFTERNGGKISVKSEPGKGSTFCFTMPKGD